ncbi:MAG: hypothetical protein IPH31_13735 [Lewinellaceae bacterium]|nr:hypothetical protein [Lewinellaceae bacterium]
MDSVDRTVFTTFTTFESELLLIGKPSFIELVSAFKRVALSIGCRMDLELVGLGI